MKNHLLKLVTQGIETVIEWVSTTLEALIDWGWEGPSEAIVLGTVLTIIGSILGISLWKGRK